jgi:hypothetical protein
LADSAGVERALFVAAEGSRLLIWDRAARTFEVL